MAVSEKNRTFAPKFKNKYNMNKEKLNQQRVSVYNTTPTKIKLVEILINLIKGCYPNVETTQIDIDKNQITLNGLMVKQVEIDPMTFGGVLIHWFPNKNISTKDDPFCSAYMLDEEEIKTINKYIRKIKKYAFQHKT